MPTPAQSKALSTLIERLHPLAETVTYPAICWVTGGDEGLDLCRECAEKYATEIRSKLSDEDREDVIVSGGYEDHRSCDGSAQCTECSKMLGYSLTSFGFKSELDHFSTLDFTPLNGHVAYAVREVLRAAEYSSDDDDVKLAIKIGRAAVAAIPKRARAQLSKV